MGRGRREVTSPQVYSPDRPEPSDFLAPPDPSVTQNPNVEWIYGKMTWIMYVLLVFVPRWILAQIISLPLSWVLVHLAHNCITFIFLHWAKGNPFFHGQGKYDKLTFWEQLDDGKQYTPTRKVLTIVPVILFIGATHYTNYDFNYLVLNLITFVPTIIGKFATMHKVRILGINRD